MNTAAFNIPELEKIRESLSDNWHEFLNVPSLSMGMYNIAAGTTDKLSHSPHDRDEVYVGIQGHGVLTANGKLHEVEAGAVIYVKAGVEHHFHDVTEDLSVLVFFAGNADAGKEDSE